MALGGSLLLSGCSLMPGDNEDKPSSQNASATYAKLGVEYLRLGNLNEALGKLKRALELDDKNIEAHDAIAVVYEKIRDYDNARRHFENALDLKPDNPSSLHNFGRYLCNRGEFDEGMEQLSRAIDLPLNDSKWFAYTHAGHCELMRGDQAKAENYFRQALQVNGRYAPALMELQKIAYRNGNFLSARAFLQRYLEVAEHTPSTLWVAIQTEMGQGDRQQAQQYREMLLQKFPNSKEAKQILGTGGSQVKEVNP